MLLAQGELLLRAAELLARGVRSMEQIQCVNGVISWLDCLTTDCEYLCRCSHTGCRDQRDVNVCSVNRDSGTLGYILGECVDHPYAENGLVASSMWSCGDSCDANSTPRLSLNIPLLVISTLLVSVVPFGLTCTY